MNQTCYPAHNAHHPATAERVRVLFTETVMPRRAIAWEVGVSIASIHRWAKRFGWVRPAGKRHGRGVLAPEEIGPGPRRASRGGKARFYPPGLVAEARRLVEETVLTRGAIARRIGVSTETIRRWRNEGGWVRPPGTTARMSAEAMATARRHCERSEASQDPSGSAGGPWVASSAAPPRHDGGGGASVVDDGWHGGMPWRDALLPRGFVVPQNRRASSGKARPYMRPVVERVRELVEGTALSQAEIAARTGIGSATVAVWMREKGWRRPLDAYRAAQAVPADRAGLSARLAAGFARVAALAEEANGRELLQRHAEEHPEGASRSTRYGCACFETPAAQAPQHDAVVDGSAPSEGEAVALARLARAARRFARLYDRAGLARLPVPRRSFGGEPWEPVRLSVAPRGPRHHPRGEDVLAQARHAWEDSWDTGETIAQALGIARATLTRWAQTGGWIRPDGAHSPIGRPRNPGFRTRMRQRIEARHRLGEAERMLEGPTPHAHLSAVFALLKGAAAIVGRPLAVERLLETPRARRGVRRSGR